MASTRARAWQGGPRCSRPRRTRPGRGTEPVNLRVGRVAHGRTRTTVVARAREACGGPNQSPASTDHRDQMIKVWDTVGFLPVRTSRITTSVVPHAHRVLREAAGAQRKSTRADGRTASAQPHAASGLTLTRADSSSPDLLRCAIAHRPDPGRAASTVELRAVRAKSSSAPELDGCRRRCLR